MADCILLDRCGFFRKYKDSLNLACRGFMNSYCQGDRQLDCRRMQYRAEHGSAPEDDMLPTGQMMPKEFGGRG
jgi:hypothetical protein